MATSRAIAHQPRSKGRLCVALVAVAVLPWILQAPASWANEDIAAYAETALQQISARRFGRKEQAACETRIMALPVERRAPLLLVLARNLRVAERRPEMALALLVPLAWSQETFEAWSRARSEQIRAQGLQGAGRLPHADHASIPLLPAVQPAQVTFENAQAVIEAGMCLADLGRLDQAMAVFDVVGSKFDEILRARAADATGDTLVLARNWTKARTQYQYGLKVLDATARYHERQPTAEETTLRRELIRKLALVDGEIEKEQFGAGWVAYREAERLRLQAKAYLLAYDRFQALRETYPSTVYAEAAECYSIQCLLALHSDAEVKKAAKALQHERDRMREFSEQLNAAKRAGLPQPVVADLQNQHHAQELRIQRLSKVPAGIAAVRAAETRADAFLKTERLGLYRGEVLVCLGQHYLDEALDPVRAEDYFSKAAQWCAEVTDAKKAVPGPAVPQEAQVVSAPPKQDRVQDAWNNDRIQEPKPGDVINRKTCTWYLRRFHREAVLKWGLLAYARGDFALAKKLWSSLHAIDPYFAEEERNGWGSVVERLLWTLEHQPGGLYAEPAEMSAFSDPRMRLAVLQADLAFCNDEYPQAAERYRALLEEPYGRIGRPGKAYLTFALTRSLDMQFKEKEAEALIKDFEAQFANTPTMPRFLLFRGNRTLTDLTKATPNSPQWKAGIRDYAELISRFPQTQDADCACYYWGFKLYMANEFDLASERLEAYLKLYPEGIWKAAAEIYLDASRKKVPFENL